jgi:hypothetical protein
VDLFASAAMLVLADREREPVRAVELDDLDLGRLSLAREDPLASISWDGTKPVFQHGLT